VFVRARILATVFLLSLTVLLLQVVLSRLFAGLVYNDLYTFPLAMAMLGLCGGGVWLYAFEERFPSDPDRLARTSIRRAFYAAVLFAALTAGINALAQNTIDADLLAKASRSDSILEPLFFRSRIPLLVSYGTASVLPFFFLGLAISALLKGYAQIVNTVYFFDLAGATLGAVLAVPLMDDLESASYLLAAPLLTALALSVWEWRGRIFAAALLALFAVVETVGLPGPDAITLRALRYAPGFEEVATRWSSTTYLQLVARDGKHRILQDHHASVDLRSYAPERRGCLAEGSCRVRPWLLLVSALRGRPGSVCVLAAGVGRQMLDAWKAEIPQIVGVEMNPALLPFAEDQVPEARLREFVAQQGVDYVVDEARHALRRSSRKFDVILIPPSGSPKATAMPSSPNHLLTEEAIAEYLSRLTPDGLLVITVNAVWSDADVRARVLAMIRRGVERRGLAPAEDHVIGFRPGALVVSPTPFQQIEILRGARGTGYQPQRLDEMESEQPPPRKLVTDDYPFWQGASSFAELRHDLGWLSRPTEPADAGSLKAATQVVALVLVLGVILLPLTRLRRRGGRIEAGAVGYFFCLGAGFMWVEIPLMEKLVFALGQPIYSISFCLAVLLASTGLGSLASERLLWRAGRLDPLRMNAAFALLLVLVLVLYAGIQPLLGATQELPRRLQMAAIALAVLPLGLLLGVPFPQGVALLRDSGRSALIPWAWGVNGAASVLAINVSVVLTRILGISPMFLMALGFYVLAFILLQVSLLRRAPP
jgi:hypothetical protein